MPFWTRRYYWRKRPQNYFRRYRFRRRGLRKTFRRRWRRRRTTVRNRHYYRNRKLKRITVKQWNPKTIHKCTVKGLIPLYVCGRTRICHNYTLYAQSYSKPGEATGGAWSMLQFTLKALFAEYLKYRNWWTKSNQGLPLTRYNGCKFKFYRSKFTDYVVTWNTCPPFSVTQEMYLNMQPSRLLMNRHKIIVPRLDRRQYKKQYVKLRLKPPSLLKTNWYFTQDICSFPLVILMTSACSLDQYYAPEDQISGDITLTTLNTDMFQNPMFATHDSGYSPKTVSGNNFVLYASLENNKTVAKGLIPLRDTRTYKQGQTANSYDQFNNPQYWGNIFTHHYAHGDYYLYYSSKTPENTTYDNTPVSKLYDLYIKCRYNPYKDDGIGNIVYWKSTSIDRTTIQTIPNKEEVVLRNYPLWLTFYSFSDWIQRSKPINQIDQNYFMVVVSPYINPKKSCYVFLDAYFYNVQYDKLNDTDKSIWHPKYEMQTEVEYFIGQTGPGAPKINRSQLIQAHCDYTFYFKWGGCPAPMETIENPCDQEKFPIPSNQQQTIKIQNPATDKTDYLYDWDERRGLITSKCAKRLKKYKKTPTSFTDGTTLDLQLKTSSEESSEETEEEEAAPSLQQQLQQLRHRQRQLKLHLLKLKKRQKYE